MIELEIHALEGSSVRPFEIGALVIAGWTGRDRVAMEHHIGELEALGVPRPATTPVYYRASAARLTTASSIEVIGESSSGEIEFVLIANAGELYVGVGSDHTDRKVETYNVTTSKQMCDKPISRGVWPLKDVAAHWDQLILRSHVIIAGERTLYQEGAVARMLSYDDLLAGFDGLAALPDGMAMFGGTLGAIGGIRPADRFEGELEDPVLGRRLAFAYDIRVLPILG